MFKTYSQRITELHFTVQQFCLKGDEGSCVLLAILSLSGEKGHVDVGEHSTGCDGGAAEKSSELFVVADSKLDVTGHNSGLLVVLGGVTGELENLSCEVFENGGKVHGGTSSNSLGVSALLEVTSDSSDGELESGFSGSAHGS